MKVQYLLLISSLPAFGQCPAVPLSKFVGNWTFNVHAVPLNGFLKPVNDLGMAGRFTASSLGQLDITMTTQKDESVTRMETAVGSFQLNGDCSGGFLVMSGSTPMQFDFWFQADGLGITMVSTTPSRPAVGSARAGVSGCPVGVTDPYTLLSGAWALSIENVPPLPFLQLRSRPYGRAGRMLATVGTDPSGNSVGRLSVVATSNVNKGGDSATITRQETGSGRFTVNADCRGGTITMALGSQPQQYDFFFRGGFTEFDVISTVGLPGHGVMSQAGAPQPCPVNPLAALAGGWSFNVHGLPGVSVTNNFARAGRMIASIGADRAGNPIGLLALNATTVFTGINGEGYSTTRLEEGAGRFTLNDDCTGGTLTMNLGSLPMQYDFFFYDNQRAMYFISASQGAGAIGSAQGAAPTACPVGLVNPLDLLTGSYVLRLERVPQYTIDGFSLAGKMDTLPLGGLAINASSSHGTPATIVRLADSYARYQINPDCSGGSITINGGARPSQYQFYFRAGFAAGDMVTTVTRRAGSPAEAIAFGLFYR